MEYGRFSERDLGVVFAEIKLVRTPADDVHAAGEVRFIFKTQTGERSYDGPAIICELATDVTAMRASEIHPEVLQKAMAMVRRLASMSDEQILERCRDSIRIVLDEEDN
jgi:hypothetical protein